jgi:hypothetical protein
MLVVPGSSSSSGSGGRTRSMDSRTSLIETAAAAPNTPLVVDYSRVCLTDDCLKREGHGLARAFTDKPFDSWCVAQKKNGGSFNKPTSRRGGWQGLLLVRPYKAASSTLAGVALRISHRRQNRNNLNNNTNTTTTTTCAVQWGHARGQTYSYLTRRIPSQSLLFAPVRRAAARAYSASFFFEPTVSGYKADDTLLADFRLQYRQWPGMCVHIQYITSSVRLADDLTVVDWLLSFIISCCFLLACFLFYVYGMFFLDNNNRRFNIQLSMGNGSIQIQLYTNDAT